MLFGALLHASWNALIKSGDDKALDTALIHVLGCGVGAVLVLVRRPADAPRRWPWLAASLVIHIGYYIDAGRRLPARRARPHLPDHARHGAAAGRAC